MPTVQENSSSRTRIHLASIAAQLTLAVAGHGYVLLRLTNMAIHLYHRGNGPNVIHYMASVARWGCGANCWA